MITGDEPRIGGNPSPDGNTGREPRISRTPARRPKWGPLCTHGTLFGLAIVLPPDLDRCFVVNDNVVALTPSAFKRLQKIMWARSCYPRPEERIYPNPERCRHFLDVIDPLY